MASLILSRTHLRTTISFFRLGRIVPGDPALVILPLQPSRKLSSAAAIRPRLTRKRGYAGGGFSYRIALKIVDRACCVKKAGVPAEMHLYAQGGHAFGLRPTKFR